MLATSCSVAALSPAHGSDSHTGVTSISDSLAGGESFGESFDECASLIGGESFADSLESEI